MDIVTKNMTEISVKEIFYADDSVLLGDSWEEVERDINHGKKFESKCEKDEGFLYWQEKIEKYQSKISI